MEHTIKLIVGGVFMLLALWWLCSMPDDDDVQIRDLPLDDTWWRL